MSGSYSYYHHKGRETVKTEKREQSLGAGAEPRIKKISYVLNWRDNTKIL